ncbi:hypothetical protein O1611_g8250 [Lasiodiplodia mahajangana]|uniref:Uncharacterized protein n=1 Tax=Lasiodiplodia mahajangana TaxID=1108764 RepID=A0ACC2JD15_9PEZI|nr:hypothetical protein O1611_g8250 [Lasiodiplodia mahajangana]
MHGSRGVLVWLLGIAAVTTASPHGGSGGHGKDNDGLGHGGGGSRHGHGNHGFGHHNPGRPNAAFNNDKGDPNYFAYGTTTTTTWSSTTTTTNYDDYSFTKFPGNSHGGGFGGHGHGGRPPFGFGKPGMEFGDPDGSNYGFGVESATTTSTTVTPSYTYDPSFTGIPERGGHRGHGGFGEGACGFGGHFGAPGENMNRPTLAGAAIDPTTTTTSTSTSTSSWTTPTFKSMGGNTPQGNEFGGKRLKMSGKKQGGN